MIPGRGGRTRTADPRVPNAVRYRTAPHPEQCEYNAKMTSTSRNSQQSIYPPLYHYHHLTYQEDIPFWLDLAKDCPGPILELGCGTGRVTLALAQAEFKVFGLDYDLFMLRYLKSKIPSDHPLSVDLIQSDFRYFYLRKKFGLIFLPCNTFTTLDLQGRLSTLACVIQQLQSKGIFAVSFANPEFLKSLPAIGPREIEEVFLHPVDGEPVQVYSSWERSQDLFSIEWCYDHLLPNGLVERYSTVIRHHLLAVEDFLEEFAQSGLECISLYGEFDRTSFEPGSPYLIILAQPV